MSTNTTTPSRPRVEWFPKCPGRGHPEKPKTIAFICRTCDKSICELCFMLEHDGHALDSAKGGRFEEFQDAMTQVPVNGLTDVMNMIIRRKAILTTTRRKPLSNRARFSQIHVTNGMIAQCRYLMPHFDNLRQISLSWKDFAQGRYDESQEVAEFLELMNACLAMGRNDYL